MNNAPLNAGMFVNMKDYAEALTARVAGLEAEVRRLYGLDNEERMDAYQSLLEDFITVNARAEAAEAALALARERRAKP
jgi:hypothetical protein